MYGIDEFGRKKVLKNKGVVSSAFGRVKFQTVDSMLSFTAGVPSGMQKRWARNFQIKKKSLSSKVE